MKNIIAFILIFLLIAPIVLAGSGRTIDLDFSQEPKYIYPFLEGDRVRFNLLDDEHTIIIHDIKDTSEGKTVELEIYSFYQNIREGGVDYVTLNEKANTLKIDLDKNGVRDLKISLVQIKDNKVWLIFEEVNEQYISQLTGRVLNPSPKKFYEDTNFIIAGIIGLIILIIILILILKNRKK